MIGLLRSNFGSWRDRFVKDASFRHLVRASFFSLIIRVAGLATGFFVTVITSRFYGADALGIVSICIAILSFASVIGKLGMDVALMRYIAELFTVGNFAGIKHVYLKSFRFIVPVSIGISAILFFLSPAIAGSLFHKPHLADLLKVNSLFVLPLVILLVNSESIRGLHRIRAYTFLQTSAVSIIATILLICSLAFFKSKYVPISIQFISITLASIISIVLFFKLIGWNKYGSDAVIDSRKLIRTSSPMFITTIMQLIMTWGGTLIMAAWYSESEVGVYNAIVRISTFTNISILAINSIASPRIAAAFSSGKTEEMKKLTMEAAQLIFLSSVVVFLPLFFFPHLVLSVFGKDFTGNEFSLELLLAGQLFVSFSGLASQVLNMADREKNLRNNALIAAVFNIGACFLLIPPYGISGACIAQVIGMVVWNVLCIYSVKKQFGFFTFYRPGKM
jgi:O-antigen/teichoic acid export membrane protein